MESIRLCPACGHPDALLALGTRLDRPHRWRPWITTLTTLYLCDYCQELVLDGEMAHDAGTHVSTRELKKEVRDTESSASAAGAAARAA